jgi:hypothetical protein
LRRAAAAISHRVVDFFEGQFIYYVNPITGCDCGQGASPSPEKGKQLLLSASRRGFSFAWRKEKKNPLGAAGV